MATTRRVASKRAVRVVIAPQRVVQLTRFVALPSARPVWTQRRRYRKEGDALKLQAKGPRPLSHHRDLSPVGIPPAERCQVWIDFDGTITTQDVLDELINRYAMDDSWRKAEELWQRGEIGSRQCLERQFAVVKIASGDLDTFLDRIKPDPGAGALFSLLQRAGVPHAVLSDGVDLFINRILGRHGLKAPVIRSNTIERAGERMSLRCPWSDRDCQTAAAHCKCASITTLSDRNRQSIYIGDGRSDLCPSRKMDFVFAKGRLAESLGSDGIGFIRFKTLADVTRILEKAWGCND